MTETKKYDLEESRFWLTLLDVRMSDKDLSNERNSLVQESTELMNIFGAILNNSK